MDCPSRIIKVITCRFSTLATFHFACIKKIFYFSLFGGGMVMAVVSIIILLRNFYLLAQIDSKKIPKTFFFLSQLKIIFN